MTEIFGMCAELYNAALESWRGTYAWWREHHPDPGERFPRELTHSKYDLMKQFTGVRSDFPEWEHLAVQVGRGILCRFDRAVRSFYRQNSFTQVGIPPPTQVYKSLLYAP